MKTESGHFGPSSETNEETLKALRQGCGGHDDTALNASDAINESRVIKHCKPTKDTIHTCDTSRASEELHANGLPGSRADDKNGRTLAGSC